MTLHYHGTPITPASVIAPLAGRNFCVSYAAPSQARLVHEIGQSVLLDNGAFSVWKRGHVLDADAYMQWADEWLAYPTTWAVIPDVVDGDEVTNDAMIAAWQRAGLRGGAPVWHMHEPIGRLVSLCGRFDRVCVGSSSQYAQVASRHWHRRMEAAMNAVCPGGRVSTWLHMLRGMSLAGGPYPFASLDSTDIARNHHLPHQGARTMADRWDSVQCPATWAFREQLELVA